MYFLRNCLSSRLWYIDVRKHMVFLRSLTWAPRAFLGFLRTNQKGEAIRGRSWLVRRNAKLWDFSAILDFSAPISFSLDELPPSDWCGEIPKRSKLHKALRTPYRGWHLQKLLRIKMSPRSKVHGKLYRRYKGGCYRKRRWITWKFDRGISWWWFWVLRGHWKNQRWHNQPAADKLKVSCLVIHKFNVAV